MKILIPILMLLGLSGCVSYEKWYLEDGKRQDIPWSEQKRIDSIGENTKCYF